MALTPKKVEHDGSFSLAQLEINLNLVEGVRRLLTNIAVNGGFTVSTHDNKTEVPENSLKLVPDPNGNATLDGAQPFCRGPAMINSVETKVAAFRKPAA